MALRLASSVPYVLAAAAGVIAFLGFAGFDIWPLALVAFVPFFFALERVRGSTRRVLLIGLLFGFVGWTGGYYWLVEMLKNFSGFGWAANVAIAALFWTYQAGQFVLFGWLWLRGRQRGWSSACIAPAAFSVSEFVYPQLFPSYYAASFHNVPLLLQICELGGPILLSALCLAVNGALFDILRAAFDRQPIPRTGPAVVALCALLTVGYGAYRIDQKDLAVASAPKLNVGIVQVSMGIFAKRQDPFEGLRRHVQQSLALEEQTDLDLLVWPESAFGYVIDETVRNVRDVVMGPIKTPLLFGGLARRTVDNHKRLYNTAFLVDAEGSVQGTYDKTYLLAFGEYIPFGEMFPALYELSPNTGHFTAGDHVKPLKLGPWRLSTLICYEDILPDFVRKAVRKGNPHLLVNITNDAWFGETTEPWIHLALAKFRAVEHGRFLVRATNSGVSAIVDPAGRVVTHSGVFTRESLDAQVAMLTSSTFYGAWGNWVGWLGLALTLAMVTWRRRPRAHSGSGASD